MSYIKQKVSKLGSAEVPVTKIGNLVRWEAACCVLRITGDYI